VLSYRDMHDPPACGWRANYCRERRRVQPGGIVAVALTTKPHRRIDHLLYFLLCDHA